jgi:type VI secretion system protein ImpK
MKPSDPISSDVNDSDRTIIRPSPGRRRPNASATHVRQAHYHGMSEDAHTVVAMQGDNPLLVSAFSLLSLVHKLRNLPFHDAVNELRERLIEEIKNFENRALSKGASRKQMDIAKYLLCSLLDETVLNTPWGSRSGWGHNSLSSLFYKKMAGGEEFFQILERLMQQPVQNKDLLELAYLCLSLGFKGKYRYTNNGLLTLERQRQELYLLIQRIKGDPEPELSTHWQGIRDATNPLIRHVPLWVLAGVAGVMLMLIFMIFAFSIRDKSDALYGELFTIAQHMKNAPAVQLAQPLQVRSTLPYPVDRLRKLLANEIAQKKVTITDERRLRIFNMFQSGSADVRGEYREVLAKIAGALQKENARMLIIGHTDSQRLKFSTRFKSNWHLSLARAQSTAKTLGGYGYPDGRMRLEAMADKDPIAPNDTEVNRALNRRIDIHIR